MSIAKHHIATVAKISELAASIIDGAQTAANGRGTYLRYLIGTLQHELGSGPRTNSTSGKIEPETIAEHLKCLNAIHRRFYAAVWDVAHNSLPTPSRAETNKRCTFARTAASAVRSFIRAGNDATKLAAGRVTKASLAVERAQRKQTEAQLMARALRLTKALHIVERRLIALNPTAAQQSLAPVISLAERAAAKAAA